MDTTAHQRALIALRAAKQHSLSDLYLSQELDEAQAKRVQRLVRDGTLARITPKIATSVLDESQWPDLVRMHRNRIVAANFPGAVFFGACALNGGLPSDGHLYLTHSTRKELSLPGLKIKAREGVGCAPGDMTIKAGVGLPESHVLYYPSLARQLVENMSSKEGSVGPQGVEEQLLKVLNSRGFPYFRQLRQEVSDAGERLGAKKETAALLQLMGEVMGTREVKDLKTTLLQAMARGYDAQCVERLEIMAAELRSAHLPIIESKSKDSVRARMNEAFLESYFSNYIEGTKFKIDEAISIIIDRKISPLRPLDSQDVQGLYDAILSEQWRSRCLLDTNRPLTEIRARHETLMQHRPEIDPGAFKTIPNMAGNTRFVMPHLVNGTLARGIALMESLPPGLPRAIFAHTLMVTVHPFNDGNGRVSRLIMNAELSAVGLQRLMVPTLFRDEYVDTLANFCAEGDPRPFIKAMRNCQEWTAAFDFNDLGEVTSLMERCNAMQESLVQYRLLRPDDLARQGESGASEADAVDDLVGGMLERRVRGG